MPEVPTPLPLTRSQIAQTITGDARSVLAIEALLQQAYQSLPAGAVLTWETSPAFSAGRVATPSPGVIIDISTDGEAIFEVDPTALPVRIGGTRSRTLTAALADAGNVNDYLNTGDTTYDGAFARALAAKGVATMVGPPVLGGTDYMVHDPVEIAASRQGIEGEGSGISRLLCTTANVPVVVVNGGLSSIALRGLTLAHSTAASAGGDGVQTLGIIDSSDMEDVRSTSNWAGFNLGNAPYVTVRRCVADTNGSHGFRMASATASALQYYLQQCISGSNAGDGFRYEATAAGPGGGGGISVGEINDCFTFNNGGSGIAVLGRNDMPIYSIRISGGFYGQDAGHEIYIDAYGNNHLIQPGYVELAGQSLSWANDPAACGIVLTGNDIIGAGPLGVHGNANSLVGPGRINGALGDGIRISSRQTLIAPHVNSNNGGAALHLTGANASLTAAPFLPFGNAIGFQSDQDAFLLSTTDFTPNTTPFSVSVPIVNSQIVGCLPASINQASLGAVTASTLHVNGASAFAGAVNVTAGGIVVNVGAGGLTVDSIQARTSLGVGTGAPGTVGTIAATVGLFSGGVTANALTSLNFVAMNGALTGATTGSFSGAVAVGSLSSGTIAGTTITSSVDIVANGTAHFHGATAFTSGGVNITAGGLQVAGGIGVDNLGFSGALYSTMATGGAIAGGVNVHTGVYLDNVAYVNP